MAPWLLLCAAPCCAQVSGSVGVVSDYRYRGLSLSDGRPALQLDLSRDFDGGAYAGLMLSGARMGAGGDAVLQWLPYVGLVRRRGALRIEGGVQYYGFSRGDQGFADAFVGLGRERVQARLHHAPRYFGSGPAWYAEIDAQQPLAPRWRVLAHVGALHWNPGDDGTAVSRRDLRLGVGADWTHVGVQLAWVRSWRSRVGSASGSHADYYGRTDALAERSDADPAWVLQVSHQW